MDCPQAPGGGKGRKREIEQKRSPQAAEAFKGTQILPIFIFYFFAIPFFFKNVFFLPLQMLNGGDYKPCVCFVLLSVESEN